jgi:mRNA interferase MazF
VKRGELYRVQYGGTSTADPKKQRVYVIVSRAALLDSGYSTVICAPVYSRFDGLTTQVEVDVENGLKHPSSVHCDNLTSLPRTLLTDYVGVLGAAQLEALDAAVAVAVGVA